MKFIIEIPDEVLKSYEDNIAKYNAYTDNKASAEQTKSEFICDIIKKQLNIWVEHQMKSDAIETAKTDALDKLDFEFLDSLKVSKEEKVG